MTKPNQVPEHKWWHWLFEVNTSVPYRFTKKWYGTKVEYRYIYCSICKKVTRERYNE
jgi:hypothetical protein